MSGRRLVLRSHACCRSSRNNAEGQAPWSTRAVVLVAVSFHDARDGIASLQISGGRPC